jgi:capsule polysaccharide export protein KpsE/RkpR
VKPANQAFAPVVDRPAEVGPVPAVYVEKDFPTDRAAEGADWLWRLWERRKFLGRVALWGLIGSTMIAFLIPKRYESTTRLMPPDTQSNSGLAMVAAMAGKGNMGLGSLGSDLLGLKSSGALFTDVLQSRTVQDRIIGRFDLRKVYGDKYWQDARRDLAQYTAVSEDRKSGVLTITVTDRDPQRAAQMAQTYVEELDRLVTQVSTSSARRERVFIEERLQSVKHDLDLASQQFSEYASRNTTVDITAQAKAMVEGAARLQGELIASQSELEGLEQIYTGNNVRVRSMRARVEELKRQLKKLGGEDTGSPSTDSPQSQEDFPSIRKLPLLGVKWSDLYRQTKIQETVYELLTQQYEIAKIQEAKEIPTVKVLDLANVPEKKASPHRLTLMILGMLLAFSAGIVWVLGAATWQQMDPQDSRRQLGQEVVARFRTFWSRWPVTQRRPTSAKSWWKARRNSSGDLE